MSLERSETEVSGNSGVSGDSGERFDWTHRTACANNRDSRRKPSSNERHISQSADRPGQTPRGVIPPKLYRIGEIVEYAGLSRQTIHNYTTMGLIREVDWTRGGHRLYDESVFVRLDEIAELKDQQRSMEFIRDHFARRMAATEGGTDRPAGSAEANVMKNNQQ